MSAVIMLMLGLLIIALSLDFTVAQIGVSYGKNGDKLPPPSRVVELYNQYNITRMRIYDTDPDTLTALKCSNIELTVGVQHSDLQRFAEDPACANAWVRDNIMNYPDVKFRNIIVGNEVSPKDPKTEQYVRFVLPAMQNIYNAISPLQLGIKVTTAVSTDVIDPNHNYPPDQGRFLPEVAQYLDPIIRFLVDTDTPLFANIYPYFAYIEKPDQINRSYALLDPNYPGEVTPCGTYKNLFYALLDTVNAALEKSVASMSFGDQNEKKEATAAGAGESGHPTQGKGPRRFAASSTDADGDDDDHFANIENAREYVNNLIQAVKTGTPRRPGKPIETYIFAMFDENLKFGDVEERHFGLFTPDGDPKYPVNFD